MSDFWVRKMKTYFQRIDFDKDGAITQKDFEGMAERFVKREKLDDAKGKELKSKLLQASATLLSYIIRVCHCFNLACVFIVFSACVIWAKLPKLNK